MASQKILLVEDDETHAHLVNRHLVKAAAESEVTRANDMASALQALNGDEFDAVLLDLSLPDSPIHESLDRVLSQYASIPVIVLTSLNDLDFATNAVKQGAQDYLVKSELNAEILGRAIRYAIEHKKSQLQLQSYATELEENNKHLESFSHTLAHEVRSPLTVISGCLQIIDGSYSMHLKPEIQQLVTDSLTSIKGMTELVECLLEFSQANSQDTKCDDVDLEKVLFHVEAILRPMLDEAGGELTHNVMPTLHGNEVQLRQLLQNLIINAIKYRGDNELEVHIDCTETDEHWTLMVKDNGKGIAPEDQKKIFNAFTRLDGTSHISGVGIGLAFCQRIVESHKGQLWVESEPNAGSTFFVQLPK